MDELLNYLQIIDLLTIKPFNKIRIVQTYVYSKFRWRFSIYDLGGTWVTQNLQNQISKYVRKWLQIPISGNITHLRFPSSKLGIDFTCAYDVYEECKLSVRRILKTSENEDIRHLYAATSEKNVRYDSVLNRVSVESSEKYRVKQNATKELRKEKSNEIWSDFLQLKEQNSIIKHISKVCYAKALSHWKSVVARMPKNIICFCRKALILSLGNGSNLKRWKISDNGNCSLCSKLQTQLHIFSNCKPALEQKRYTWRHDSVLFTILHHLKQRISPTFRVYADCVASGLDCTSTLFETQRPDIVIANDRKMVAIELTIPYETNSNNAKLRKRNRYKNLKSNLIIPCDEFEVVTLEVTTLGFVTKDIARFKSVMKGLNINTDRMISKMSEVALRATFFIYCRRNKVWENPELLQFY